MVGPPKSLTRRAVAGALKGQLSNLEETIGNLHFLTVSAPRGGDWDRVRDAVDRIEFAKVMRQALDSTDCLGTGRADGWIGSRPGSRTRLQSYRAWIRQGDGRRGEPDFAGGRLTTRSYHCVSPGMPGSRSCESATEKEHPAVLLQTPTPTFIFREGSSASSEPSRTAGSRRRSPGTAGTST